MERPDAGRPPPPDGFGRREPHWEPSPEHDAVEVATLHIQHRIVAAARRAWEELFPGVPLTGKALAARLDTPGSVRPFEKRLAGDQHLQLRDIAKLAAVLGDDILTAVPGRVSAIFPAAYQPLLQHWEAGKGQLPELRPPPALGDWRETVSILAAFITQECDAGRDHLLGPDVVAFALAQALHETGADASQLESVEDDRGSTTTRRTVAVNGAERAVLTVAYLPDRAGQPQRLAAQIMALVQHVSEIDADYRIAVLAAGALATGQCRAHLPESLDAAINSVFTMTFQRVVRAGTSTQDPAALPDLHLQLVGRARIGTYGHVIGLLVDKR